MSISGAMNTAVSGLNAESAALASISNNVANSQTVGFKQADTSFVDYLTQTNASTDGSSSVVAKPQYTNDLQGTVAASTNPTSLAISGQGFFPVQRQTGELNGQPVFNTLQFYTRAGDFTTNINGNLVNSAGYTLDAYPAVTAANGTTTIDKTALKPVHIDETPSSPVATTKMAISANLPATPPAGAATFTSTQQVYDPLGNMQDITLTWTQVPAIAAVPSNQYTLSITAPGSSTQPNTGPLTVTFGTGSVASGGNGAPAGSILSITDASATDPASTLPAAAVQAAATPTSATPATVTLALNYGTGAQPIVLNLGTFQSASGVTQYSGSSYQVAAQSADGTPQGNFSSVSIAATGNVVINYDNGATKTIAQVSLATFASPDSLQSQDGQAYTQSLASGSANVVVAGTDGAGTLTTSAVEGSNVDIATEFTNMIVAQRAYEANAKMITTASSLLQVAIQRVQG